MPAFLFVISLFVFIGGCSTNFMATTALHEIQGYLLYLVAAVLFVGACISDRIDRLIRQTVSAVAPGEEVESVSSERERPEMDSFAWGLVIITVLGAAILIAEENGLISW